MKRLTEQDHKSLMQNSHKLSDMLRSLAKILCLIFCYEIDYEKMQSYITAFHKQYAGCYGREICEVICMKFYYYRLAENDSIESLCGLDLPAIEKVFESIKFDVVYQTTKGYVTSLKGSSNRYKTVKQFMNDYTRLFLNKQLNIEFDPDKNIYNAQNKYHLIVMNICLVCSLMGETSTWLLNKEINEETYFELYMNRMDGGDNDTLRHLREYDARQNFMWCLWKLQWDISEEICYQNPYILKDPTPFKVTA